MKRLLLILLLRVLHAQGQDKNTIAYGGYINYLNYSANNDSVYHLTILNSGGYIVSDHTYHESNIHVKVTDVPIGPYLIKINGHVIGRYACANGKILFDVGSGPLGTQ